MAHNTYNAAYNFAYNEGGLVKFVWKNLWAPKYERDNQGQGNYEQQHQQQQQQQQQHQQPSNNRDYNGGGNNYNNQPQRPIGG